MYSDKRPFKLIQSPPDINAALIKNPASTFFLRVSGDGMKDAGISDGDTLMVDKSLSAKHGDIVVAVYGDDFRVRRLFMRGGTVRLLPANLTYPEIRFNSPQDLDVWGVVTACIKLFKH